MKRYAQIKALSLGIVVMSSGCATIPKEAIELNKMIGENITESQRTHVSAVNALFASKRADIDDFITREYMPAYIENVKVASGGNLSLNSQQQTDLLSDVMKKRDQMMEELERTRILLLEKMDVLYYDLIQANAAITGVLSSAVKVQETTEKSMVTLEKATAGKADLESVRKKIDEYILSSGDQAGKAIDLYESVKSSLEGEGNGRHQ